MFISGQRHRLLCVRFNGNDQQSIVVQITLFLLGLLTFGVSVLLGNPLTAASTFTSVALLNMLIGPLNAFPWVLNGLIEAWVSLKRVQELIDVS